MNRTSILLCGTLMILYLSGCERTPVYVNQPPTAMILASPTEGDRPLRVDFDATLSSDPENGVLTYSWDFGDGSTSTSAAPSNSYNETGTFTVTLTVADAEGLSDTEQTTIKVNEPPNLVPITDHAQWVYLVKHTETENGEVSGYEEG